MFGIFRPAPHQAPLPDAEVDSTYRRLRWQIFAGIFIGYAGYYLLRKNFSLAMPYLIEDGYSRGQLGVAMSAIAIAYGLSKFIMGLVSDRSNPRVFLPFGLLVSAAVMFISDSRTGLPPASPSCSSCSSLTAGPRAWAGRRADGPWSTGGRRRRAAAWSQCGTSPTMSAAA